MTALASNYEKSTCQLLIRWLLQHDIVTIPKSTHREQIRENANVPNFAILDEDMAQMNPFYGNSRVADDPRTIPNALAMY